MKKVDSCCLQDGSLAVVGFDKDSYSLPNVSHAAAPPALDSCCLQDGSLAVVGFDKNSLLQYDYERCAVPPTCTELMFSARSFSRCRWI